MIIKSNCKSYELYLSHILTEVFPRELLNDDKDIFELNLSESKKIITATVCYHSLKERSDTSVPDFPSENTAKTCAIGRAVIALANRLGYSAPPYGVLTGVRPIKIASSIIASHPIDEFFNLLNRRYLVRQDKSELLLHCTTYDKMVRSTHSDADISLYISIPFCPSRCNYCSFVSASVEKKKHLIPVYLDILLEEMKMTEKIISRRGLSVRSIYVGGGTPGILSEKQLELFLNRVNTVFISKETGEFSFEIGRPDTVTREKLELLKKYGVDRVSINTQSTNDEVLHAIGRGHTSLDFFKSIEFAKEVGFDSINTDLIAGLSSETLESFKKSLTDVTELGIDNVTIHILALKKSAKIKEESIELTPARIVDEFISFSKKYCISQGFEPYYLYRQKNAIGNHESVGYCKRGKYSHYNIAMMNEIETVIGLGAGATSRVVGKSENDRHLHFENYKYPDDYIRDKRKMISHINEIDDALKRE